MAGVLIALASILVFSNTLYNTFALDDYYRVVDNPGIQQFWPPWRHFVEPRTMSTLDRITQYRPLLPLTLSINSAISGNSVVGYHIGNLFLHILASLIAYTVCLELLRHWSAIRDPRSAIPALFAALLFAIHPVSGIAVNYISARDLLLMQVFFLAALLAYARMRRLGETTPRWAAFAGLLFLSLLSKTNLAVAPLLFLVFDIVVVRDSLRDRRVWLRAAGIAAVVATFFVLTRLVLGFSDLQNVVAEGGSPFGYALTQARLHVFHYLPHFWWPFPIRLLPQVEPARIGDLRVWLGLVVLIGTMVLAWRSRSREPIVAFGLLAYLVLLIPESSVLPFYQVAVDYRTYPGSIFLFLAVTLTILRFAPRSGVWLLAGFTVYIGAVSMALNRNWSTAERLWTHSVTFGGDATAHMNLAMSIPDRADPRIRKELEEALRLNPAYVLAHINLCLLQIRSGEAEQGIQRCEHAVRLQPQWAQSHYWLASAYRQVGRARDANASSTRATELDPVNLEYRYQAMLDAQAAADWTASLRHADALRRRAADYKELRFGRGFALQMLGRNEEALVEYREFLRTNPNHAQVNFNAGYALMGLNRCAEAIPFFEQTLRLRPEYAEAKQYLEKCR